MKVFVAGATGAIGRQLAIAFGARVARQNSRAATDNELYPLNHLPLWQWEGDDNASESN